MSENLDLTLCRSRNYWWRQWSVSQAENNTVPSGIQISTDTDSLKSSSATDLEGRTAEKVWENQYKIYLVWLGEGGTDETVKQYTDRLSDEMLASPPLSPAQPASPASKPTRRFTTNLGQFNTFVKTLMQPASASSSSASASASSPSPSSSSTTKSPTSPKSPSKIKIKRVISMQDFRKVAQITTRVESSSIEDDEELCLTPISQNIHAHKQKTKTKIKTNSSPSVFNFNEQPMLVPLPLPLPPPPPPETTKPNHDLPPKKVKIAFTNFHNSSFFGKDSVSAFLGEETSLHHGQTAFSRNTNNNNSDKPKGLLAESLLTSPPPAATAAHSAPVAEHIHSMPLSPHTSHGSLASSFSSSLRSVDENNALGADVSYPLLIPLQSADSWGKGPDSDLKYNCVIPAAIHALAQHPESRFIFEMRAKKMKRSGSWNNLNLNDSHHTSKSGGGGVNNTNSNDNEEGSYFLPSGISNSAAVDLDAYLNCGLETQRANSFFNLGNEGTNHFSPVVLGQAWVRSRPRPVVLGCADTSLDNMIYSTPTQSRHFVIRQTYLFEYRSKFSARNGAEPLGFGLLSGATVERLEGGGE